MARYLVVVVGVQPQYSDTTCGIIIILAGVIYNLYLSFMFLLLLAFAGRGLGDAPRINTCLFTPTPRLAHSFYAHLI